MATDLDHLYRIREALGFNDKYPLSNLEGDARSQRRSLLACVPVIQAVVAAEAVDAVGNSDLDGEQPVTITIRTTLGAVRKARSAIVGVW